MNKAIKLLLLLNGLFLISGCNKAHNKTQKLSSENVPQVENKLEVPPYLDLYNELGIKKEEVQSDKTKGSSNGDSNGCSEAKLKKAKLNESFESDKIKNSVSKAEDQTCTVKQSMIEKEVEKKTKELKEPADNSTLIPAAKK